MTTTAIRWAEVTEKMRSNRANEALGRDTLAETQTHNRNTEYETNRTNVANEVIKRDTLEETARANRANESIKVDTLNEQKRSNLANESIKANTLEEQKRANRASETIRQQEADASTANAQTRKLELNWKEISDILSNVDDTTASLWAAELGLPSNLKTSNSILTWLNKVLSSLNQASNIFKPFIGGTK